jgi:hypothetical protein
MSSGVTMPRSPWLASAGWTKKAGVPVEASVAATLRPTWTALAHAHDDDPAATGEHRLHRGDEALALARLQPCSARASMSSVRRASSSTRLASKAEGADTGVVAKASSRIGRF